MKEVWNDSKSPNWNSKVTVKVVPSPTFFRWVFGWNGEMKIIAPYDVRENTVKWPVKRLRIECGQMVGNATIAREKGNLGVRSLFWVGVDWSDKQRGST